MLLSAAAQKRRFNAADVRADILIEPRLGRLSLGTEAALRAIAAGRAATAEIQVRLSSVLQTAQQPGAEAGVGSVAPGIQPLDFPAAVVAARGPAPAAHSVVSGGGGSPRLGVGDDGGIG